jgi:hypothetical protein
MATFTFSTFDEVRVLYPFAHTFDGVYAITDTVSVGDDIVAYALGDHGAFDPQFLARA